LLQAWAFFVDELGDGALGAGGLQELDLGLSELEEGGLDLLVFYNFDVVALRAQYLLVVGELFFDALHGDAEMFDVGNFHCDSVL